MTVLLRITKPNGAKILLLLFSKYSIFLMIFETVMLRQLAKALVRPSLCSGALNQMGERMRGLFLKQYS